MRRLAIVVSAFLLSCTGARHGSSLETRLATTEAKLASMERRLADVEIAASKIDAILEGVSSLIAQLQGADGPARKEPDPSATYSVPIDGNPFIGPKLAKVTMVQGYDFYCGFCDKVRPVLVQLRKEYGDSLKIVFKDFVIHEEIAQLPALAACAAHEQGKFMPMFDAIWTNGLQARQELTEDKLLALARKLNLAIPRLKQDMNGTCLERVRRDFKQLSSLGARGTPAFFINGRFIAGALPIDRYRVIIDEELAKAEQALASGTSLADYYPSLVESGRKSL